MSKKFLEKSLKIQFYSLIDIPYNICKLLTNYSGCKPKNLVHSILFFLLRFLVLSRNYLKKSSVF